MNTYFGTTWAETLPYFELNSYPEAGGSKTVYDQRCVYSVSTTDPNIGSFMLYARSKSVYVQSNSTAEDINLPKSASVSTIGMLYSMFGQRNRVIFDVHEKEPTPEATIYGTRGIYTTSEGAYDSGAAGAEKHDICYRIANYTSTLRA